ncbi:MAG: peptidoglycan bridge formation glycyltransferase FemA/FemB family protein [Patescibacteria group bacterium]|nr:peptidoglycan bridge formation glycyltransferase FemA/FemB family protein [Patescibacteria group bacterium]
MKPTFCEITAEELDAFAAKHPHGNIHQTSKWVEFQSRVPGRGKCLKVGVRDGDSLRAAAALVRQTLPFGLCWYFIPRGPLLTDEGDWEALWAGLKPILKKEKCVFLRIEFPSEEGFDLGRKAHAHFFPEHSLIVDLGPEEEVLKQMKQKGRYNIKVAKKHGVEVRKSQDAGEFFEVFKETTARDGFSGHSQKYYEDMLEALGDAAELWVAEHEGRVLAGAIVTYFGETATYYFGASSSRDRKVMAPYLLHWEIMKDARARGCRGYDLFGVAPEGDRKHPWVGVTAFKEKFGGRRVEYFGAREKVMRPFWYFVVRFRKMFK